MTQAPSRRHRRRRCGGLLTSDRADEAGTQQALQFKEIQAELFDPTIGEHQGRLVKTTGAVCSLGFGHVVDAPRRATEVQTRNRSGMLRGRAGSTVLENLSQRKRV
jgi:hypothetical protein